jgi:transcriptional regulator with XRE-family HTH domain
MFSIDSSSLGNALRLLRARQNLTQGAVAARAGLTKAMLSSYEIGSKLPSFQSLTAILSALDRNFHDLQEALDEIRERPASTGIQVQPQRLGKALRSLRDRQRLTQVAVANKARLTKAMLSCYETGIQFPSLPSLAATLGALGANLHDLQEALDQVQEPSSLEPPRPARRKRTGVA